MICPVPPIKGRTFSLAAAFVISQVAVVVVRENQARGEVCNDAALRAFEDRSVRECARHRCSSWARRV